MNECPLGCWRDCSSTCPCECHKTLVVVDLERHNDGESGLVGPFEDRDAAERFIAGIPSEFERRYATVREVQRAG
ncbi:hypothetical protein PBI_PIPEFISH_53 [Mycobacterium phage Pipefish]|uniref:Uncharacterized protein n=1 Tax=Mycobacterium phage Pipefish TaxID=373413 RepID=Q19YV2_9CAUD|nr:gp53 [Mycobacterium phage Pipefish]ABD58550.1 hypothetical protein PBI_PIPEFISH_53 [Mycobacterium phage Pipefish]